MYKQYTSANLTLIFISVIVSAFLIISNIYYWEVVDFFALPFYEAPKYHDAKLHNNFYYFYSAVIQQIDTIKANTLDMLVTVFGYEIDSPFKALFTLVSALSISYILLRHDNKIAYVPLLCCLAGWIIYISIEPVVTIEQIGKAISAESDSGHPDNNNIDLLRDEKYAELDAHLENTEKLFASNDINEHQYIERYNFFETATKDDLPYFKRWLTHTTDKKHVLLSRGILLYQLGWDARGRKFAKDTTVGEFALMREYFGKAVEDFNAVLDISDKSLLPYMHLIGIAAAYDFGVDKEEIFDRGIQENPASYKLASTHIHMLQPKWGGSFHQIHSVVKRMRKQANKNPKLILLGNLGLTYRAKLLEDEKDDTEYIRLKRFSLLYGAEVQTVLNLSLHYDKKDSLSILSHGIKLYPENARLLLHRAHYYAQHDDVTSATKDIEKISPEDISETWESDIAANVYTNIHQPEKGIPFYTRSIELNPNESHPYNRLYWLSYKKFIDYKEALPYMKQWTEVFPESSDAWISYASTLEKIDEKLSIPAYKKFLEYADRNNSIDMNAITHVEKLIKKIEFRTNQRA